MPFPKRRPRQVDTSMHCWPPAHWADRGGVGRGHLRANGHPNGGPWRPCHCTSCGGYVCETHGTLGHSKRVSIEVIVRVIAGLAEGLGIRSPARGVEVDPNPVLGWVVEAADQLRPCSKDCWPNFHLTQGPLDALSAVLGEGKTGALGEAEAIARLDRSPPWVGVAMDPESKGILPIDVGERPLALAPGVVQQVAQG